MSPTGSTKSGIRCCDALHQFTVFSHLKRLPWYIMRHRICHASSQSRISQDVVCCLTLRGVVQSVRQGKADQGKYHRLMRKLLEDVKRRAAAGHLLSSSVAGHLLNIRQAFP